MCLLLHSPRTSPERAHNGNTTNTSTHPAPAVGCHGAAVADSNSSSSSGSNSSNTYGGRRASLGLAADTTATAGMHTLLVVDCLKSLCVQR
jgi:hypothetical protein